MNRAASRFALGPGRRPGPVRSGLRIMGGLAAALALLASSSVALAQQGGGECEVPPDVVGQRPGPADEPLEVRVDFYVFDIESIDDSAQEFVVDFVARASWEDARLGAVATEAGGPCSFSPEAVWNPMLQVLNRRDLRTRMTPRLHVMPDGTVSAIQRFYGAMSSPFDLREFPFDTQVLPISAISFFQTDEVRVVADESETGRAEGFTLPGWHIAGERVGASVYEATFGKSDVRRFGRVDYAFTVQRDVRFYRWKVVLPLVVIVIMSWSVFLIDPTQVGPQLGAASTSILTLIAFLFSLRGILPPISYLTRMDFFVYASLALVFVAYLEALATIWLATNGREELARSADRVARVVVPACSVVVIARVFLV